MLYRGTIPCDLLFVGEAPGPQENLEGKPFVGPAGKLLNRMIERARLTDYGTYGITNVVACYPLDEKLGKFRPPTGVEADLCAPRLVELKSLTRPKGVILLGATARLFAGPIFSDLPCLEVWHPAYLLRKGGETCREYAWVIVHLRKFLDNLAKAGKLKTPEWELNHAAKKKD